MTNADVARLLQETGDLIELTGGNPHRARAFSRAARSLSALDTSAAQRLRENTLTEVSGIGNAMADHIREILHGGSFDLHDELVNAVPPGLLDVMKVKGLGTKRSRRLWRELDITSLDDLEAAAESNRIQTLDGFGTKTEQNILENVRQLRRYQQRRRLDEAWDATQSLLDDLRRLDAVDRAEPTGALRRRLETVEEAAVLVATTVPTAVREWVSSTLRDATGDENAIEGALDVGIPIRVHLCAPDRFGTAWWRTTGSAQHCAEFEEAFGAPSDVSEEAALFANADLSFIPPELREERGELEAAAEDTLPSLVTVDDLEGCLHNHSTYSDGARSLKEMADAARDRGYSYFAICDHSQSLRIANGLTAEQVREQRAEVNRLNEEYKDADGPPFHLFHGIESDILSDGSLDYEPETLDIFDIVVASVHTGFNMTEDEATRRLVRAVGNPYTRILGHPTGRLLLQREGYPIDHERVIQACAEHDVAIEVNANPHRLDLDWRWVRAATDRRVLISINPDAHAPREIDYTRWGVAVARKGWLTPDNCLNAKSLDAFASWVRGGDT